MGPLENGPFLAICGGGATGQPYTRRNAIKTGRSPTQGANLNVPQEEMVLNDPKRPKNGKMEPAPALLHSSHRTFRKRTVFGNLWRRPHGAAPHKKNCYLGSVSQDEMLLREEFLLNLDQAHRELHVQRANLNVPQEEVLLNMERQLPRSKS